MSFEIANEKMKKTAFIFPGQGSQSLAMLADFAAKESLIEKTFQEASSALAYDLWELVQKGPEEKLNQTQVTQPAILTASVAIWRLFQERYAVKPAFMAGHSLGEYSALVCAGVLDLGTAVKLVEQRGNFMQQAVPLGHGAMAAILGLGDQEISLACEQAAQGEIVSAVNFNSPGQVVIAGHANAVNRAIEACKQAGAKKAMPLAVSVPSHCLLMEPAASQLQAVLSGLVFKTAEINVVNNVDVAIETDAEKIKDALVRQLTQPVRWVETINLLAQKGCEHFIECGPGKVLSGLNKRIDKSLQSQSLNDLESFERFCAEL